MGKREKLRNMVLELKDVFDYSETIDQPKNIEDGLRKIHELTGVLLRKSKKSILKRIINWL